MIDFKMIKRPVYVTLMCGAFLFAFSPLGAQAQQQGVNVQNLIDTIPTSNTMNAGEKKTSTTQTSADEGQKDNGANSANPVAVDNSNQEDNGFGELRLYVSDDVQPDTIPSLLFTYWEETAIQDAKDSIGFVGVDDGASGKEDGVGQKPPPEKRDIKLGGIVYKSKNDWTIWLNSVRVTPKAVPKEVIDLKVFDEYIELKWFDDWNNRIYPIRLRPHQRFNIDTLMFLPG